MYYTLEISFIRVLQSYTLHPPQLNLPIIEPDNVYAGAHHHSRAAKLSTAPTPAQLAYCGTRPCTTPWSQASFMCYKVLHCILPSSTCLLWILTMFYALEPSFLRVLQSYTLHSPELNLPIVKPDHVLHPGAQLHSHVTKLYNAPSPAQLAFCVT